MSLDLCLKQLHVVHIKVFHRMQYIRLLLFYWVIFQSVIYQSVIFQSCKFQSPRQTHACIYTKTPLFFISCRHASTDLHQPLHAHRGRPSHFPPNFFGSDPYLLRQGPSKILEKIARLRFSAYNTLSYAPNDTTFDGRIKLIDFMNAD